jgi:N6-adenosine-specific RNA methylase IME4
VSTFRTFLFDPPWEEHGGGGRGCQNHYETMPVAQMPRAIMAAEAWRPAPSCHAWMWATRPFLDDAMWLLKRLGFIYKTELVWVKVKPCSSCRGTGVGDCRIGQVALTCQACEGRGHNHELQLSLGQYARTAHESLLLGTRGSAMMPQSPPPSVFFAPVPTIPGTNRRQHSAKPDAAYNLIEQLSPGPRVEFFSRAQRPGWTTTGLDADGQLFTAQESLPL